ncbi:type II toxin-antitoxin system VapC family toxin [Aquibium oceanicum]|uniref:PIN domain-containing protein n=1 Tax=Aquibium oceanicum TaxID=1670800 RepID=A0A1L3SM07_9HYPH|nr:type II toxin-antitoxin system VapC family toxin [Aquibium oceanicum]APH70375.1 hypothetical protein BSQ44_02495 [Aquibium oceanicum]
MSANGLLIDTHVLLWELMDSPRLSPDHRRALDSDVPKFVSAATIWEIAIKSAIGKLRMPNRLLEVLAESDIEGLLIRAEHAMQCALLPRHHGDPFDRMLIAQARLEGLTILTIDRAFRDYDVAVV